MDMLIRKAQNGDEEAFINIKQLKGTRYFKTWIIKILINRCNDIVKDNKILYV